MIINSSDSLSDNKHTVLVVEDHGIHRQSTVLLVNSQKKFQVVAQAENASESLKKFKACNPDLVVMDLKLPDSTGIEATKKIKKINPDTKVLILTALPDEHHVYAAFSAGVDGYISKRAKKGELSLAMSYIVQGCKFISPLITGDILKFYLEKRNEIEISGLDKLTMREIEVLKLVKERLKSSEIAKKMGIGLKTVEKHRSNILDKLNLPKGQKLAPKAADILLALEKLE